MSDGEGSEGGEEMRMLFPDRRASSFSLSLPFSCSISFDYSICSIRERPLNEREPKTACFLTMSISSPRSLASSIDCRPDAGASVVCRCDVGSVLPLGAPGRTLPFCLLVRAAPTVRLPPLERVPPLWRPIEGGKKRGLRRILIIKPPTLDY